MSIANVSREPYAVVVKITPEMAQEWLNNTSLNRRISPHAVRQMAMDITAGRWVMNGETIKIDVNGLLIDGQHRCAGVIVAGQPIEALVMFNAEPHAMETVDIGRPRRAGDILAIRGIAGGPGMSATAGHVLRYQESPGLIWGPGNGPTKTEIVNFAVENKDLLTIVGSLVSSLRRRLPVTHSAYGSFLYLALIGDYSADAEAFHQDLVDGANLSTGDPRLVLRNYLGGASSKGGGNWGTQKNVAITIKAFNQHLRAQTVKQLVFRKEELPMPIIGK